MDSLCFIGFVSIDVDGHEWEWKRRINQSWVKRTSFLGLTGDWSCCFIHKTTPVSLTRAIPGCFYPPILREWLLKSQLHSLRKSEREGALPLEISENRPLYFYIPFCRYEWGKMDWSRGRGESGRQTERSMPDCNTKSEKKIKCFSLLLGSCRCAGLVTLATGNGAEHLIGVCACECVSHAGGGHGAQKENWFLNSEILELQLSKDCYLSFSE